MSKLLIGQSMLKISSQMIFWWENGGMQSTDGLTIEEEQYNYWNICLSNNYLMWIELNLFFSFWFKSSIIEHFVLFLTFSSGSVLLSALALLHHWCHFHQQPPHLCYLQNFWLLQKCSHSFDIEVFILFEKCCQKTALLSFYEFPHHKQWNALSDSFL